MSVVKDLVLIGSLKSAYGRCVADVVIVGVGKVLKTVGVIGGVAEEIDGVFRHFY